MDSIEVGQYIKVSEDFILDGVNCEKKSNKTLCTWEKIVKKGIYIIDDIYYNRRENTFDMSICVRNKTQMNIFVICEESEVLKYIKFLPKGKSTELLYGN